MKKNDRISQSLSPLFSDELKSQTDFLIFTSSSDAGVIRNLGRNGARYAPAAILNILKKMNNHFPAAAKICAQEVANQKLENENFALGQRYSSEKIYEALKKITPDKILFIGGGHDHISPALSAIDLLGLEKIIVINVDAHCDTRIDDSPHSGTPFRDFAAKAKTPWHLYQYGIHSFANSKDTMSDLPAKNMTIKFLDQALGSSFIDIDYIKESITDKTALFFSLDADALESATFESVSAVNHMGLPLDHVSKLMDKFFALNPNSKKILGIYEYNPVYDNLSQKGARALAYLIQKFWNNK